MKAIGFRLVAPLAAGALILVTQAGWFDGAIKLWGEDEPQYMSPDNPWAIDREAEARAAETAIEAQVYWSGCNEARAAGVENIRRGTPGYREDMDGDGDGYACEPYRGH